MINAGDTISKRMIYILAVCVQNISGSKEIEIVAEW
jgi:hypothetical protein